jgi:hypothetical protein
MFFIVHLAAFLKKGVGVPNCDEGTDTVVLEVYMYFVLEAIGFLGKFRQAIETRSQ